MLLEISSTVALVALLAAALAGGWYWHRWNGALEVGAATATDKLFDEGCDRVSSWLAEQQSPIAEVLK